MNSLTMEVLAARRLPSPAVCAAIRKSAGVSQERLARELSVHRVSVNRWEHGTRRPQADTRRRYMEILEELRLIVAGPDKS